MLKRAWNRLRAAIKGREDEPYIYVPRENDVFLISYPKSGNTWMRFLLANYLFDGDIDIPRLHALIPDVHLNPQDIEHAPEPRIIKSHEPFNPSYRKVIYIVRDVRDVAVSYYFYLIKMGYIERGISFGDYLDLFVRGELDDFGSWGEHVSSWLDGPERLLLIRYEDMLEDAEGVLSTVLSFIGLAYNSEKILRAVDACSLDKLRQIENRDVANAGQLSNTDPNIRFFRKGIAGDWKNYFDDNALGKFESEYASTMARVGLAWSS